MFDVIKSMTTWTALVAIRIVLIVVGFFVVPFALPFAITDFSTIAPYGQREGYWVLRTLPKWAWLFGNDIDGTLGDRRGYYATEATPFGLSDTHWFSEWWWLCIRNPTNNLRLTKLFSCNVEDNEVVLLGGDSYVRDKIGYGGWQFVKAGEWWYAFYGVWEWPFGTRAFVIRFGFKVEPRHNSMDWDLEKPHKKFKGFTLRISPYNNIT